MSRPATASSASSRLTRLLTLGLVLLLALTCLSAWLAVTARREAAAEVGEAARTAALREQIEQLRHRPSLVEDQQLQQPELARRIEQAMGEANLLAEQLDRIAPGSPRRLGESDYLRLDTQVHLRRATLAQLVRCLYALTAQESDLHVTALRLVAPRGVQESQAWQVEFTVTYIFYAPPPTTRRAGQGAAS